MWISMFFIKFLGKIENVLGTLSLLWALGLALRFTFGFTLGFAFITCIFAVCFGLGFGLYFGFRHSGLSQFLSVTCELQALKVPKLQNPKLGRIWMTVRFDC